MMSPEDGALAAAMRGDVVLLDVLHDGGFAGVTGEERVADADLPHAVEARLSGRR